MPSLEDFLGKPSGRDWTGWEELYGQYGCQHCEEDLEVAYFNQDSLTIMWVCSQNHESTVTLV